MKAQWVQAVVLLCFLSAPCRGVSSVIAESFDAWSKNIYAGGSTYHNPLSGRWYTENAVVMGNNNYDRGHAVRFNRSGSAPFLEYLGPTGQGLNGGIEAVSFEYAHWNADGKAVRFEVQYSTNGVHWVALDDEVTVTAIPYTRYTWSGLLLAEPLFLRVQSTAHSERLLLNDFEIHSYAGPRVHVATNALEVSVVDQVVTVPIWVDPPAEASVDIAVQAGGEWQDTLFSLLSTQVLFTAESATQTIVVAVYDPDDPVPDPVITLSLTNVVGAVAPQDDRIHIRFLDQQLPRASLLVPAESLLESADPLPMQVHLSEPGDAEIQLAVGGEAVLGVDYTLSATQLVFHVGGAVDQTVWLHPIDNQIGDGDRLIEIELVAVEGANLGEPSGAAILLLDDEPRANFTEVASWTAVGEAPLVIPVELDHAGDASVNIEVITDALAGVQYELSTTNLVFTAGGAMTQDLIFSALDTHEATPPFRVELRLQGNDGFRPGWQTTHHIGVRSHRGALVMAANLTSGGGQQYEAPGRRILRGLMPDVVGIQEFRVHGTRREFVDQVFGTDYHYVVEEGASLPCGIISRWPIIDWGVWPDPMVGNRNFVWAIIDAPHFTRRFQIFSAHYYASGSATDRNVQAMNMIDAMSEVFDPEDYVVVAADLNTQNRSESSLTTLGERVLDDTIPSDQEGNPNTNMNRNRPYDFVLPDARLEALHRPLIVNGIVFPGGLVFDSRVWEEPPYPILIEDSGAEGMQHMAVGKFFAAPETPAVFVRRIHLWEGAHSVDYLERGNEYQWVLEWGIEGPATVEPVVIEVASLSADIVLVGECTLEPEVSGAGTYLSAGSCVISVGDHAGHGMHALEITFQTSAGDWVEVVDLPVYHDFIGDAVDTPGWTWTYEGDWFLQTNVTSDGISALMIEGRPETGWPWIRTEVQAPGRIVFDWWLNEESGAFAHYLLFSSGGLAQIKFASGWETVERHVSSMMNPLQWSYYNFGPAGNAGHAVIDQIRFEPYTNPVLHVAWSEDVYHITAGSPFDPETHRIFIQNLEESPMHYVIGADQSWVTIPEPRRIVQGPFARGHEYALNFSTIPEGVHTARFDIVASSAEDGSQSVPRRVIVHPALADVPEQFLQTASGGVYGLWGVTNRAELGDAPVLRSGMSSWQHPSWLIADVPGPGLVSFLWRNDALAGELELILNGVTVASLQGASDWTPAQVALSPGTHRLEWWYRHEGLVDSQNLSYVAFLTYEGEPDRDGDGLPDWWEEQHFGGPTAADPLADMDGDGYRNWQEFVAGTNPLNSNSFFRVLTDPVVGAPLAILFADTLTNRQYTLYGTVSLSPPDWQPLGGPVAGTGGMLTLPLTNGPAAGIFRGGVRLMDAE